MNRITAGPMRTLLTGILVFHAGWYMLLPYFAVLFTTRRGLTPAQAGLVLAAQSFTVVLGSLAGGFLADKIGRTRTMVAGLLFRAVGLGALGLTTTLGAAVAVSAVAGLGGGLYGPSAKAAISVLADDEEEATAFSWRGIAANVGVSLGPVVGALLVRGSMPVLFGLSGLIHAGMAFLTARLPAEKGVPLDRQVRAPWHDMFSDMPYLIYSLVSVVAWGLFSQLAIAMPLYASRVLGLEAVIGLLWTMSSLVVIALQVPLTRYVLSRMNPLVAMGAGTALFGAGLGLVGLARGFPGLMMAVLVFIIGEMFVLPTSDVVVSRMAMGGALGSYFGISSFAWGLGDGFGALVGGAIMNYALGSGRVWLPWLLYAAAGLGGGLLFVALLLQRSIRERLRLPEAEAETAQPAVKRVQLYRPGHPVPDEAVMLGPRRDNPYPDE